MGFEILIPLLFFYLDKLDQCKAFTQGYLCYAKRPASIAAHIRNESQELSLLAPAFDVNNVTT